MIRAVVFVEPSRPAGAWPGVALRGAAVRGDLLRAVDDGYTHIGLIDGRLYSHPTVPPSEVVEAGRRATLFGAASLGALRAAECPGVMVGVGDVYQGFRTGRLRSDDEVVGAWDPATGAPTALPLVVVRDLLARASAAGVAEAAGAARVLRALQRLPFHERTPGAVAVHVRARCGDAAAAWVEAARRAPGDDVKQRDARALLDLLAALVSEQTGAVV